MAKQLNVNLAFTADTGAARQQLQNLQTQLSQLANTPVTLKNGGITQEIINASNAAAELKIHLEQATNIQTGNLDFSKLNQSIKNSGSSLAEYGEKLKSLGPAGNTAFQALAQSVAKAEIPIRRSNAALTNMWTTLKNTARWQMSSSMLHGFMGAVQSAFGYAQDLNESLNNIRIVTGQNIDQMARFAEQANKAAKALSTTTTEYTNASLIYYQQGLSDSEVAARTEVTIKMANAAGQSAQMVSDQLTAVWNNFAKGGENLEYYADVMTALGAATASSTDEISEGLNKFASVAETVGLSYEYAASALATVTATTRQSADVVGTAFKTLFARIQDLELGKTLDDGTTLGTYSQALQKVGVNIKDANGEMKNMDIILSEMAAKWTTLNKDQQVALAQSVAGVRQYTQLIALMDNWDFMEQNLETSYGATGTLDEQAEIYAESWEAAQKRVSAAAESIYSDLLNDDFFIDVLNGFEKFLTLVDKVIDGMGGLQGVLAGVSALMLKVFNSQVSQSLTNMAYSIQMMTKSGRQKIQDEQTSFIQSAATSLNPSDETATVEGATREASLRSQLQLQVDMITNSEKMSTQEMQVNQMLLDRVRLLGEEVALKAQAVDLAQEEVAAASTEARADAIYAAQTEAGYENRGEARKKGSDDYTEASATLRSQVDAEAEILAIIEQIQSAGSASTSQIEALEAAINKMDSASNGAFKELVEDELDAIKQGESVEMGLREIAEAAKIVIDETGKKGLLDIGVKEENVERVTAGYRQQAKVIKEKNDAVDQESQVIDDLSNRIINAQGAQKSWADTVVSSAQSISSLSMGISSLGSIVDTISNPDMSGWEKFTSIIMSLSMGIPMLISGLSGLNTTLGVTSAIQNSAAFSAQLYLQTHKEELATLTAEQIAKATKLPLDQAEIALSNAKAAASLKELVASKAKITSMTAEQLAEKTGMTIDQAKIVLSKLKAGATLAEATQEAGLTGIKMGGIAATVAQTYAKGLESGARWANVVAMIAEQTAMAPLLVITLLLVAAMIAIAAIIWVVVSAVQSITAAYNADAIAAENAADAAKNLAAAYKEVKAEYDDMISAMDNYQTARDGLDSLTEGTLEYQEALQKANEYALELIEAGNLVKGQDYTVENGEIIISDEAMQSAKEKKFNEVQDAYAVSTMANAKAAQAKAKSSQTDLIRKNDGNAVGNATAAGAAAGAAIGSFIPGIGTAIGALGGAVIGAIGGAIYNGVDNSIENGKIDELTALYDQIGEAAFDSATLQELGFDTANQAYIDSVKDVVRETNIAAEQMEVAAELAASAVLEKNEAYQNSEHQDKIAGAAGKGYQAEYEKAYEEAMKQTKNNDWFGIGSKENKAAMEEYAKQMGLNDLNGFKVTNYKKGGNVEYEYIDENGEKKTVEITQQQIAAQLASTKASEELAKQTQTLLNTFNRLEDSTNKADQALADFASGDLSGASKSEFEDMESELADSISTDENGNRVLSDQGALDYINANFSAEELQAMGYVSAEEAAAAFKQQFDANLKAWDSIELPENLIGTGDMSLKTAQNFQNALNDINFGPAGEQAGKDFVDGINKMVEGLNTEDQQTALEELSNIDWSDWDALEQADAIMKEYGVDIDTTSKEWVEYANKMRIAAGATPDFSKLKDTLTSITSILQDLDFGSVVSEEDYQKLVQYNDEWERFFMLQADGTRVFIGDSQAMQRETRADIIAQREALQARKEAQEGFENANWGHYDETGENWIKADWGNKSGSDTGTATNLMNASGATEDMLEELGYTDEVIQDMITKATSGQADLVAEGEAALREMYQRIDAFTEEELAEMDAQFDEMMASTATNVTDLQNLLNTDQISEEAYDKQLSVLANNAKSLEELKQIQASGLNGEIGLDTYEYGQALINLASNFDNCAEEIAEYEAALLSGDTAQIEAARSALELSVEIGEMAEKFDLDAKETENYAKRLSKSLGIDEKAAAKLAVANQRLDRGLLSLNENLEDYQKSLKTNSKNSAEWSKTMDSLKTDLADMFNLADGTMLSDEFAEATLASDDFKKALDGDVEALGRLQTAAADDIMINVVANQSDNPDNIKARWEQLKADFAAIGDIDAPGVDQSNLLASFNEMIAAGNMTKEQIEAALAGLHVSANVKTTYVSQKTTVPQTITKEVMLPGGTATVQVPGPDGTWIPQPVYLKKKVTRTYDAGTVEVDGVVPQYEIEGTEGKGGITTAFTSAPAPTPSYSSTTSGSSGGGGGGGSDPSTADKRTPTKKSDTVERYREVSDAIDNVTDALTRAERATDRLWGKDKLNAMREENKILEEQKDLILEKAKEAEEYAKEDAKNLRNVAKDIGVSVVIDQETGDITNIEDVEETLYNRLAAAEAEYNAKVDAYNKYVESLGEKPTEAQVDQAEKMKDALDAYEEDIIGKIEKDIEAWEDAEQQFQESVETWEDAGLEAEEILDQIMQNNYDIIMEGLEIPLSLNEEDLRLLELQLAQIEDDVYSMAEAVALTSSQFGEYQDNLRLADEALEELNKARELGKQGLEGGITEAAYQEGLAEIRDKYYENIEALMELDKTMEEYYGNTIDMANEELSKYTDQMEHQTSVLEHYQSLIELMGKSGDYKMMGKVLEGQVETTKNALDVSRNWYETQRANADSLAAEYAAAQARGASEAELEIIKANWDAAEAAANEAQEQMLSDAEAWAEALKAVLENKLADLGQTLENALTGGTSFDALTTQMERANSLQEEYLTTTNQIYETNKLMRTAQQEIDKTTNSAAKKRLQAYINETQQLQDQSKLSQYELEIQQAKYDLLLAEIALEEAQDAKSTVRLQRDAEGNFGYVYTADQNKLAEAEQQLADAQNNLYNIGLEGANDYASKYQETLNEMYDTLADLQQQYLDGSFESEAEYQQAMEEAKAYYYQKLQDYSSLYSVALTTDSRVVADAWSTDFNDMIYKTDEWMSAVDAYADGAIQAFREWQSAVTGPDGVTTIVGSSIEEVGNNVQDVTDKSKALADTVNDDVIPALDNQLDSVQNLTGAYAALRDTIQEIIEEYNLMISSINGEQQSKWDNGDSGSGSGNSSSDEDGSSGSGDSSSSGNADSGTGGAASEAGVSAPVIEVGKKVQVKTTATHFSRDGGNGTKMKSFVPGSYYTVMDFDDDEVKIGKNNAVTGWVNKTDLVGFRTGGYTGTWEGSYGKLAFLHQKEMVLNAQDTENLLSSMELLNQILEMIDLQSASAQLGGLLSTPGFNNSGLQSIEQNVHIEASFPGVQDRSEIEEAFNNLINQASQYANRK